MNRQRTFRERRGRIAFPRANEECAKRDKHIRADTQMTETATPSFQQSPVIYIFVCKNISESPPRTPDSTSHEYFFTDIFIRLS